MTLRSDWSQLIDYVADHGHIAAYGEVHFKLAWPSLPSMKRL